MPRAGNADYNNRHEVYMRRGMTTAIVDQARSAWERDIEAKYVGVRLDH